MSSKVLPMVAVLHESALPMTPARDGGSAPVDKRRGREWYAACVLPTGPLF